MKKMCKKLIISGLIFSTLALESNISSLAAECIFDEKNSKSLNTITYLDDDKFSLEKIKSNGIKRRHSQASVSLTLPNFKNYNPDKNTLQPVDLANTKWYEDNEIYTNDEYGNLICLNEGEIRVPEKAIIIHSEKDKNNIKKSDFYIPLLEISSPIGNSLSDHNVLKKLILSQIDKIIEASKIPNNDYDLARRIIYLLSCHKSLVDIKKNNTDDKNVIEHYEKLKNFLKEYIINNYANKTSRKEYNDAINAAAELLWCIIPFRHPDDIVILRSKKDPSKFVELKKFS